MMLPETAAPAAHSPAVIGLLLAGGQGRRMGGADKGLLLLQGQPLAQHMLQRLQPQVQRVLISANRHLAQYRAWGLPVLPDAAPWQGMGPLAALATLAQHLPQATQASMLVQLAPCDTPRLPADLVHRLAEALRAQPACDVAYPDLTGAPQPALMLAKCSALPSVAAYLATGQRSMRGWLATRSPCAVPFADAAAFANANDPQALLQLEQILSHHA